MSSEAGTLIEREGAVRAHGGERREPSGADEAMLKIRGISFSYPGRQVLKSVDLSVRSGEILVLLGPNGAGKSTLVKTISGQIRPSEGKVTIEGREPAGDAEARGAAGFVPQRLAIFDKLTVRENLVVFGQVMGAPGESISERADQTAALIGLAERRNDRAAILSGGMQRLVNIGAALMHGPRLLVLDEPTVGVDNRTRDHLQDVLRGLKSSGLAILLTTHDMEEAEALADRISIIVGGEIKAEGPAAEIVETAFGSRQEVRVLLDRRRLKDNGGRSIRARLKKLGLEPSPDETLWEGLIDNEKGKLAQLDKSVSVSDPCVREVRIRAPGLRTLLAWYTS